MRELAWGSLPPWAQRHTFELQSDYFNPDEFCYDWANGWASINYKGFLENLSISALVADGNF